MRKSIAILAGNWSAPSKALMESFDVSLFEVSFAKIVDTLADYGVDILWGEKDRQKAILAQKKWSELSLEQREEIAHKLLSDIEPYLRESMKVTLDGATPREISKVEMMIETNLGESRRYIFTSINAAIDFLEDFDEQEVLNDENGPALWAVSSTPLALEMPLWAESDEPNGDLEE